MTIKNQKPKALFVNLRQNGRFETFKNEGKDPFNKIVVEPNDKALKISEEIEVTHSYTRCASPK